GFSAVNRTDAVYASDGWLPRMETNIGARNDYYDYLVLFARSLHYQTTSSGALTAITFDPSGFNNGKALPNCAGRQPMHDGARYHRRANAVLMSPVSFMRFFE